ncbi:MAG TPA: hypothetical protein VGK37_04085 [Casimicrobiaceae bacterium]|jgi:hypothetical protein
MMASLSDLAASNPDLSIDDLLKYFQPSAEERHAAQMQGILTTGLGLLANSTGPTLPAVGRAGLLGQQARADYLKQNYAERNQNVTAAAQMLPILRQMQQQKMLQGVNWNGTTGDEPAQPYAPTMQQNFSLPQGQQSQLASTFNAPTGVNDATGNAPPMNFAPPPVPPRPPTAGRANTGNWVIDQAINTGVPPAVVFSTLQGPNGFAELAKITAEYGKPQNLRANGTLTHRDPRSGQVIIDYRAPTLAEGMTVDGQGNAIDVPNAQEGLFRQTMRPHVATALSTPQETIQPGGSKGFNAGVSRADVLWPGGAVPGFGFLPQGTYSGRTAQWLAQQQQAAGQQGQQPPQGVTPQQWAAVQADQAQNGQPGDYYAAPRELGGQRTPLNGGAQGQYQPQAIAPRTFQTQLSPQVESESKSYGDALTKRYEEIATAGRNGAFASGRWGEMQKLASQFDSGAFTPARARIASYFNAAGASPDTVSAVAGGSLPAIEGFGKLAFESTLNQIKQFSSRPAMQEVVLAMQNNPNIGMTVPGRNLLLQTNKALADYNVNMFTAAKQYRQQHNGSIDGFEEGYYAQHPPESVLPSLDQIEAASRGKQVVSSSQSSAPGAPPSKYKTGVVVQLPNGQFKDFPSQQYADRFKAAAGLQ